MRGRVAENVYVFTSDIYAKANAGAIVGPDWSVLIDTLAFPEESQGIRDFLENTLGSPVRYVINTHYHADHSLGNSWFPDAIIVSHSLCRELIDRVGRSSFKEAQRQNRDLQNVRIVLPDVVFDEGSLSIRVGKRTLQLNHLPGHSPDGIGVTLIEDRVMFSGDVMMPIPYLVDGDYDVMVATLKQIPRMKLENLVPGHGEVILRGEVQGAVKENLNYLAAVRRHVRKAARRKNAEAYLKNVNVESCGKSRILLDGLAQELHTRNLLALYKSLYRDQ